MKFLAGGMVAAVSEWLIGLPGKWKVLIAASFDAVVVPLSLWLAFWLRLGEPVDLTGKWGVLFVVSPLVALPFFAYIGLYRVVVRHLGHQILWMVAKGVSLAVLVWGVTALLLRVVDLPRSVVFIYGLLAFLFVGVSRLVVHWLLKRASGARIVIYGAGNAGAQLATALHYGSDVSPVAFIDDEPRLHGHYVAGLRVYAPERFAAIMRRYDVREVLIAIPFLSRSERSRLIRKLEPYAVRVRVMPPMSDLAQGRIDLGSFHQIDVEDLLGRDPVPPRHDLLRANIAGQNVLVTGAGGSIGSELCCQIAKLSPRNLVILEQSESALYRIEHTLREGNDMPFTLTPVLGSVTDRTLVDKVLREHSIDTLYHAAAYKHVPIVEDNVVEGVRNNVRGTRTIADAALEAGVTTVVLISTDKAVNPSSVMGASKRLAEMVLQGLSRSRPHHTRFSVVRFGNVLDSSGSVVQLFRRQIKERRHLTVTDPKATRYFMTVDEAVELVIQAGAMAKGGEIFVLDMGEPVRIGELASNMIRLSGLQVKDAEHPEGDIEIRYTGLRPGEKLKEELLAGSQVLETENAKIMRLQSQPPEWPALIALLDEIDRAILDRRTDEVRRLVFSAVGSVSPGGRYNRLSGARS